MEQNINGTLNIESEDRDDYLFLYSKNVAEDPDPCEAPGPYYECIADIADINDITDLWKDNDSDNNDDSKEVYMFGNNERHRDHDTACIGLFFILSFTIALLSAL